MLTQHSETSARVVPGRWVQKNCEGMARTERQYVRSALQARKTDKGSWTSDVVTATAQPSTFCQTDADRGCLVTDALEENTTLPDVEELVRWSCFTLFAGSRPLKSPRMGFK